MKNLLLVIFAVGMFSCSSEQNSDKMNPDAKLVWINDHGKGRQVYLAFRNDFILEDEPYGTIHLYAHARYHLIVNGTFINFGPVRAYPESPEYDSYDISSHLKPGKNFILVKVLNDGMITYQVPEGPGAFIAWGEIHHTGGKESLATPGNWRVRPLKGFDPTSPKMTFATGALENYDGRKDPQDINSLDCDLSSWNEAVLLMDQSVYNDFIPRSIPYLTQDEKSAFACLGIYSLQDEEDIYSFRLKAPDETREAFGKNRIAFAQTYIYSPVDQSVTTGLWWGEYFLNGEGPLKNYTEEIDKPNRRDYSLKLNKGWNHFFISYGIVWASWEFYMSVPKSANLSFSPYKKREDSIAFLTAGPFTDEEEQKARNLEIPFEGKDALLGFHTGWKDRPAAERAGNPTLEIVLRYFDELIDHGKIIDDQGREKVVHGNHVPMPVKLPEKMDHALIFDMGGKTLGRIFLKARAPEGTVFNIGFSEDTIGNRPWILKRAGLFTGTRFTSDGLSDYFETFNPYGVRFLQLNVENASGPVAIEKLGMISQVYPFEKTGSFECSDPLMNQIWELGWRTLQVCSEDTYTDTPFRERGLYAGDALPQYAITLATSGDSRLMMRSIRVFANMYKDLMIPGVERDKASVNHMADYPLATMISWLWTIAITGDMDFASKFYDGYKNMLLQYISKQMNNGLFEHERAFIEWTQIDKNANLTTIQSLLIFSLESFAWLAETMDHKKDASTFRLKAEDARNAMLELCWDNDKEAFRDGFRNEVPINHHYPISSAWPVMFGQTTPEMNEKIREHFIQTLTEIGDNDRQRNTTPYGAFYILEALYKLGMEDFAEYFIRKYWSAMIYKHNDTAWENFGDGSDGSGQGTLSHAWSGHPTYFMSSKILGVQLGFPEISFQDRILIRPQASNIKWARGTVPHPLGLVKVDWRIEGEVLFFDYLAPDGIKVEVKPEGKLSGMRLVLNSRKI